MGEKNSAFQNKVDNPEGWHGRPTMLASFVELRQERNLLEYRF